jgi:predicted NBD/HSP70 family sugar kinase
MYYIGIDVSTKESALCILDGKGKIVRETKLPTDPEIIARFIAATGLRSSGSAWNRGVPPLGCLPGCSPMAGR